MTEALSSGARRTAVPAVSVEALFAAPEPAPIVDLRSPAEFAADHVTGARSVPLFDDVERALVGRLYRRSSPEAAFAEGRALASARIARLVGEVALLARWSVPGGGDLGARVLEVTRGGYARFSARATSEPAALPPGAVVLHCWRGGLRSRSVVAFLRELGLERAVALDGGYKAYRRHVLDALAALELPPAFVLRGLTGAGKTLVLRELEALRPGLTLDLEREAGHRSSLLGMVGLEPCTQKTFETRLFERARRGFGAAVVLEGESRKVGDAIIPERVWRALSSGTNVELVAPRARRVQVLLDDYLARREDRPQLRAQLAQVEARMTPRLALLERFDAGREAEVVELLLEHYYDPLYRHSERDKPYALTVDASDPAAAAERIAGWIEGRAAG